MKEEFAELAEAVKKTLALCPWIKQQTLESYKDELLSEAEEMAKAVDNEDYTNLKEEVGDLLWDIVMFAHLAEKKGHFRVEEAVKGIVEKMKRRKPYIFEGREVSMEEAVRIWDEAKNEEH